MDTGTKRPWQSMTFWGIFITLAGMLLPQFGVSFDEGDQAAVTDLVSAALETVGLATTAWGRFRAKTQVTLAKPASN